MKNVVAALIFDNGCVLLTRRAKGQTLEGFWEFPGGKQNPGESIQECLERELLEELTVASTAGETFMENIYEYENGAINLITIITHIQNHDFKLSVHDRAQWVPVKELMEFKLSPADIPVAKRIIEKYA